MRDPHAAEFRLCKRAEFLFEYIASFRKEMKSAAWNSFECT
jgi:hypothetical protein